MGRPPRLSEVQAEVYPHDFQPGENEIKDDRIHIVNNREILKNSKKNLG